jgi:hypothetical protein
MLKHEKVTKKSKSVYNGDEKTIAKTLDSPDSDEKNHAMELLNEMGSVLSTCEENEEVYTIFHQYVIKFFPNYQGKLMIYSENDKSLHTLSQWGYMDDTEDQSMASEDCWAIRHGKMYLTQPTSLKPFCAHAKKEEGGYLCLRVIAGGNTFGIITINFSNSA